MDNFSQGREQDAILSYFGNNKGVFFDGGCNDGITINNTRALALLGWSGILVDASKKAYSKLYDLYGKNDLMDLFNNAISDKIETVSFYESGEHLGRGDVGLLSSMNEDELKRWQNSGEQFTKTEVDALTFDAIIHLTPHTKVDFISLDIEGEDLKVLRTINLSKIGCSCLCIEHNGNQVMIAEVKEICRDHGLKNEILRNAENIILSK